MKLGNNLAVLFNTLILGAMLAPIGCATTGNQRSADTRVTMKAVEQDYIQAISQVDATDESLEVLINPNQPDKKKPLEKYSANVNKMKNSQKRLFDHADKMQKQQKDYFEEWRMQGNTYTNPQIQALSDKRRADLSAAFAHIAEESVGVKGAFKSYMSDIAQISTYLSTDLTPKGVESITPIAQKAVLDGDNLKQALNPVLSAIHEARSELAQGDNK
jgi:predicted  nucleic acid-binding Zn-ribbon protein